MAIDTQEALYLQALDNYPFDIEQCMEKLQYAISGGTDHAGVHYLLGRIYAEQSGDYQKAMFHYKMALSIDHRFVRTYYYYVDLLINLEAFDEALKVLQIGQKIPGIDKAYMGFLEGILYEKYEMFESAKECYKNAKKAALNNYFRSEMDEQIKRVKNKKKDGKPKKGKSTKKKK